MNGQTADVVLRDGLDFAEAIASLIRKAHPADRVHIEPTGRYIPELSYSQETVWEAAAEDLAKVLGKHLARITDVWMLSELPHYRPATAHRSAPPTPHSGG